MVTNTITVLKEIGIFDISFQKVMSLLNDSLIATINSCMLRIVFWRGYVAQISFDPYQFHNIALKKVGLIAQNWEI